ncbi:unnamed protein product [Closterium sp. NIES-53]
MTVLGPSLPQVAMCVCVSLSLTSPISLPPSPAHPPPGLNNTLKQYLPTSQMTVLVPRNSAFSKLTGSFQYSKLKKNPKALLQVMAFHVWKQRFSNTTLQAVKVGTQFATLDYK